MEKAAGYLDSEPRTVTADTCPRSKGGKHDFYSEGDYWWPDPKNPDGPYIRRDGETNPDNFLAHRESMVRLSDISGTMASAWLLTKDDEYAAAALRHFKAWFVDEETKMNPGLLYGQAISGKVSGRSIGVIDTIHLAEVAEAIRILQDSEAFPEEDSAAIKAWFSEYLLWLNTHPYGLEEKKYKNNHGVCWSLQAAAFAKLTGDEKTLEWIRERFRKDYLGRMMDADGSFPEEPARTKPYGYSLFVIDAMAGVATFASDSENDLWRFRREDGRCMELGVSYIAPFIKDRSAWPLEPDVLFWDEWPVRHPALLLGGLKFDRPDWLETWSKLEADPKTFEVLRNLPLRHPVMWAGAMGK